MLAKVVTLREGAAGKLSPHTSTITLKTRITTISTNAESMIQASTGAHAELERDKIEKFFREVIRRWCSF